MLTKNKKEKAVHRTQVWRMKINLVVSGGDSKSDSASTSTESNESDTESQTENK